MLALFFVACGDKEKDDTCPMECPEGQVSVNIEDTDAEAACKCQDVPKEEPTCDPVCTEGQTCACTTGDGAKCECKAAEDVKPSDGSDKTVEGVCVPECTEGKECKCTEDEQTVACTCMDKKDPTDADKDKTALCNPACTEDQECVCADNEAGDTLCTCNEKKADEATPVTPDEGDKKQEGDCKTDADCEENQTCNCLEDECVCAAKGVSDKSAETDDKKDETSAESEMVDPCKDKKAGDICDTDKTCQTEADKLVCK